MKPDLIGDVFAQCPPRMFSVVKHADLATVLLSLAGGPVDAQVLLSELTARGLVDKIGGAAYLHTLMERAFEPGNAARHAQDVREAYRVRRTVEAGTRLVQYAENPEADLAAAWLQLLDVHEEITELATPVHREPAPTVDDLLAADYSFDWQVEGLLERGDRLILTGGEGTGKSYLLAQFATCLAAGCHPFTGEWVAPQRVLVVDCENPGRKIARRYRQIIDLVDPRAADTEWRSRLHILRRPEGIDVVGRDHAWLEGWVASTKPDILVIGPLYRLAEDDLKDEATSKKITVALDAIRIRHNLTLLTEAHSGHAEDGDRQRRMRPYGSSLWMRWSEFGYGMRRSKDDPGGKRPTVVDFVGWRGDREERDWPEQLEWGGPGRLPWVAKRDDIYARVAAMHRNETA